jgi:hypothetical protein
LQGARTVLAVINSVTVERRSHQRRDGDRRTFPSETVDVTRLEHENLYEQVEEILRMLKRMEAELRELDRRVRSPEDVAS